MACGKDASQYDRVWFKENVETADITFDYETYLLTAKQAKSLKENSGGENLAKPTESTAKPAPVSPPVETKPIQLANEPQTPTVRWEGKLRRDQWNLFSLKVLTRLAQAEDVEIDVNVLLEGSVSLGDRVRIGPHVVIRNARIGDDVEIQAHSVIDGADVGSGCRIGPFARLRPETKLAAEVHIGNFVEIKKSEVETGSKINHLSYVGDASVGSGVNIGAGTITCNYDGVNKFRTVIEDGAFIGSDSQLVAPVRVGKNATIGAGSTITKDAPDGQLTLSRSRQVSIEGWQRPKRKGD